MKISRLIYIVAVIIVASWLLSIIFKVAAWLISGLVYVAAVIIIIGLISAYVESNSNSRSRKKLK